MAEISPLRRRMIEDMTVRNLSPATQQSYLNAVSKFSRYFGRSPDRLGLEDVHAFQVHLVATGISWPALNQIVCALRFFYGVTLGQAIVPERIAYAREPSKLPVVLSADEVVRFLEAIPSLKSRTALTTVYAAGLRVSEVVLLKIADIDSQRMVIRVEQGKGGKDRYVMLSPQLLQILRSQKESEFAAPLQRLNLVTSELQEGVMKTRMQPIGNAWQKLPRIVRDLASDLGKRIEIELHGAETELDRQVLDLIKDPLTHMVRNSADHGLEMPADRAHDEQAGQRGIGDRRRRAVQRAERRHQIIVEAAARHREQDEEHQVGEDRPGIRLDEVRPQDVEMLEGQLQRAGVQNVREHMGLIGDQIAERHADARDRRFVESNQGIAEADEEQQPREAEHVIAQGIAGEHDSDALPDD